MQKTAPEPWMMDENYFEGGVRVGGVDAVSGGGACPCGAVEARSVWHCFNPTLEPETFLAQHKHQ